MAHGSTVHGLKSQPQHGPWRITCASRIVLSDTKLARELYSGLGKSNKDFTRYQLSPLGKSICRDGCELARKVQSGRRQCKLQGENCRVLEKEAPEKLSMIGFKGRLEHLEGLHDQILQELDHRTESPSLTSSQQTWVVFVLCMYCQYEWIR